MTTNLSCGYDCTVEEHNPADDNKNQAACFTAMGYRRTSNRFGHLSRIDRPDWKEHMAQRHSPWSKEEGRAWVRALGDGASDHYRRVFSKDTREVSREVARLVPTSNWDLAGFVPLPEVRRTPKLGDIVIISLPWRKDPE